MVCYSTHSHSLVCGRTGLQIVKFDNGIEKKGVVYVSYPYHMELCMYICKSFMPLRKQQITDIFIGVIARNRYVWNICLDEICLDGLVLLISIPCYAQIMELLQISADALTGKLIKEGKQLSTRVGHILVDPLPIDISEVSIIVLHEISKWL